MAASSCDDGYAVKEFLMGLHKLVLAIGGCFDGLKMVSFARTCSSIFNVHVAVQCLSIFLSSYSR